MSGAPDEPPDRHRVFFALWPDDATRSAMSRATREAVRMSGGRAIAKERLHLTVAFLGELTAAGVDVARGVPPISVGPFELVLDAVGVWPESKILWLAPSAPPAALVELEARLWDALVEVGFHGEERVYRPHVTLARRARAVEAAVEPVRFDVRELALVESFPAGRNVHYEVLERWPL
jgi:2'-5' RNA ligase